MTLGLQHLRRTSKIVDLLRRIGLKRRSSLTFAFVRNSGTVPAGTDEYVLRSLNGVGRSSVVTPPSAESSKFNSQSLHWLPLEVLRALVTTCTTLYHPTTQHLCCVERLQTSFRTTPQATTTLLLTPLRVLYHLFKTHTSCILRTQLLNHMVY